MAPNGAMFAINLLLNDTNSKKSRTTAMSRSLPERIELFFNAYIENRNVYEYLSWYDRWPFVTKACKMHVIVWLTHWERVKHVYVTEIDHHWFR